MQIWPCILLQQPVGLTKLVTENDFILVMLTD